MPPLAAACQTKKTMFPAAPSIFQFQDDTETEICPQPCNAPVHSKHEEIFEPVYYDPSTLHRSLPTSRVDGSFIEYAAGLDLPMYGDMLHSEELWYLNTSSTASLKPATLSLYINGFTVKTVLGEVGTRVFTTTESISWSPFTLIQATRMATKEEDAQIEDLRLFRISLFHFKAAYMFGTRGEDADTKRTKWLAVISRIHRAFVRLLFPDFVVQTSPAPDLLWTVTRILAGYLLQAEVDGVSAVFCELHAHYNGVASLCAYTNETCTRRVLIFTIDKTTQVSETIGVDTSCFTLGQSGFSARSAKEKSLWVRAIQNLKAKMAYGAPDPSSAELDQYRSAIQEYINENMSFEKNSPNNEKPPLPRTRLYPDRQVDDMDAFYNPDMSNTSMNGARATVHNEERQAVQREDTQASQTPQSQNGFRPSHLMERRAPPSRPSILEYENTEDDSERHGPEHFKPSERMERRSPPQRSSILAFADALEKLETDNMAGEVPPWGSGIEEPGPSAAPSLKPAIFVNGLEEAEEKNIPEGFVPWGGRMQAPRPSAISAPSEKPSFPSSRNALEEAKDDDIAASESRLETVLHRIREFDDDLLWREDSKIGEKAIGQTPPPFPPSLPFPPAAVPLSAHDDAGPRDAGASQSFSAYSFKPSARMERRAPPGRPSIFDFDKSCQDDLPPDSPPDVSHHEEFGKRAFVEDCFSERETSNRALDVDATGEIIFEESTSGTVRLARDSDGLSDRVAEDRDIGWEMPLLDSESPEVTRPRDSTVRRLPSAGLYNI